ncbi:hypothetical protein [Klebsiella phage ST512-KPC3phi13.5]|nr:hypothetical protein [Klebsiella phage ST512-KPC3phi13.5]
MIDGLQNRYCFCIAISSNFVEINVLTLLFIGRETVIRYSYQLKKFLCTHLLHSINPLMHKQYITY